MGNLGDVFGGKSANDIKESSFDPLPDANYTLVVIGSEMKDTKSGGGAYLNCEMEVVDGQYKGRKLFTRFNLKNANATAVSISQAQLAALCRAVRVLTPRDSSELHDKPFDAHIIIKAGRGDYGPQNEIKEYACRGNLTGGGNATNKNEPWKR